MVEHEDRNMGKKTGGSFENNKEVTNRLDNY
jgi:hypothetical protein